MSTSRIIRAILLLTLALLSGCVANRHVSPEAMAKHRSKRYSHLSKLYPPGTSRDRILAEDPSARLIWHLEMFTLPLAGPVESQAGTYRRYIESDLPRMVAAARVMCSVEPKRVDVFEAATGTMYLGTAGHYVFYDDQDRVLVALGSPW